MISALILLAALTVIGLTVMVAIQDELELRDRLSPHTGHRDSDDADIF
ncbi:MAG: hypothetical protein WC378_17055 [Opitutaceae bacterium]|jgi:hypothetical protein